MSHDLLVQLAYYCLNHGHQGPVPEKPMGANPGLKFCSTFLYLLFYASLRPGSDTVLFMSRTQYIN